MIIHIDFLDTGYIMDSNTKRSEEVIEDFKKHKVASSAWYKIHRLIEGFEENRRSDRHWAKIGLIALALMLAGLSVYFFGNTEVKIS